MELSKTELLKTRLFYKHLRHWLINWVTESDFSSQYSRYHKSQTIRARELKFQENVHPPQHVTCHMSWVTCHVSHVKCCVFFFVSFTKWWSLSVEGLLSTGCTPSSLFTKSVIWAKSVYYLPCPTVTVSLFVCLSVCAIKKLPLLDVEKSSGQRLHS